MNYREMITSLYYYYKAICNDYNTDCTKCILNTKCNRELYIEDFILLGYVADMLNNEREV